jgi:hypothetical protein
VVRYPGDKLAGLAERYFYIDNLASDLLGINDIRVLVKLVANCTDTVSNGIE